MSERDLAKLDHHIYKPFDIVEGFSTYSTDDGVVRFVQFKDASKGYILEIKPHIGFVPKSGLIVARTIEERVVGKKVLDMCTGETGIIAIHAAVSGASEVIGVDVDNDTVNWAEHNANLNELSSVRWLVSNLFTELGNQKFDVIISNPPQMPMEKGPVHDWGGENGRNFIERIIEKAPTYLNKNGDLYILVFDFLGVDRSYGNVVPLQEIFKRNGFDVGIIAREKRRIRKGGQTEKSLAFILREYPRYNFESDGDSLYHDVLILKATSK